MPDTSAAAITIGGHLGAAQQARDLVEAVQADGAGYDWQPFADAAEIALHIAGRRNAVLTVDDTDAPGGLFPTIEEACGKAGLSFHRCDDGHYAYAASHRLYAPHLEPPLDDADLFGTIEVGPCVPLDVLMTHLTNGTIREFLNRLSEAAQVPLLTMSNEAHAALLRIAAPPAAEEAGGKTNRTKDKEG